MRALILGTLLAVSAQSFAAEVPASVDAKTFADLISEAKVHGVEQTAPDGTVLRSLSSIVPDDRTVAHKADYFSTAGNVLWGQYVVSEISVVSEDWQKDDKGNWTIDQWMYYSDLKGNLTNVVHGKLVEGMDGQVLDSSEDSTVTVEDVAVVANWNAEIALFAKQISIGD